MFYKFKILKNELCPCNSGKLYKDCCFAKPPRTFHSDKEKISVIGKQSKNSRLRTCLYKGCTAKAKDIILAHALQNNRILSKLSVNNYVLMQNTKQDPTMLKNEKNKPEPFYFLEPVHKDDATVQTCFCKKHDNDVFKEIEKQGKEFCKTNLKQIFLFSYKTFSFEYYKELATNKLYTNMFREIPQLIKNPLVVYNYRQSAIKKMEMDYYKDFFDNMLISQNYSELESVILELPYQIQFANYMCVAPPFDLVGKKIKVIDRKSKMMRRVFITIFPENQKSYVIVSALKTDIGIYKTYLQTLRNAEDGLFRYYFNVFIPLYSENLVISPDLWSKWSEKGQLAIQYLINERKNYHLLKSLQSYLRNNSKKKINCVDSSVLQFDFFIKKQ